jgi:hypothetical protein
MLGRLSVVVPFVAVAHADVSPPAASWTADLDGDGSVERITLRCAQAPGEDGEYLVQRGAKIWRLPFYQDGKTDPCNGRLVRRRHTIEHTQAHPHGWRTLQVALREGRLTVVREDYVDDATEDRRPVVFDADAQGRWARLSRLPGYDFVYLEDGFAHLKDP